MSFIFPYKSVPKDSKIILYGASFVGEDYYYQILSTNYCSLVAMVDQKFDTPIRNDDGILLCDASKLPELEFDFIVLAVELDRTAAKIKDFLISRGIAENKIIYANKGVEKGDVKLLPEKLLSDNIEPIEADYISIAFGTTGGLGDYIVTLKVIDAILELYPNCKFHIYSAPNQFAFAKTIYGHHPAVAGIYDFFLYNSVAKQYDIAMWVTHFIRIDHFNKSKVIAHSDILAKSIQKIIDEYDEYAGDVDNQFYNWFGRCKLWGLNRYTALAHNGALLINDKRVKIYLNKEYEQKFSELGLKKYITINTGTGLIKIKTWAKEKFEELTAKIKAKYKDVEIVQIGGNHNIKIAGVDKYILGQSMELTKYVLKGALAHVDCEGGLVHLATQLGTKCIVIGAPTPIWYYKYEENEYILSDACNECDGVRVFWNEKCVRGYDNPPCMESITVDKVLRCVDKVLGRIAK